MSQSHNITLSPRDITVGQSAIGPQLGFINEQV